MSEEERLQLENELLMTCSKAQAINKYIDELEESSKLSELWCKSQQENKQLKEVLERLELINAERSNLIIDDMKQLTKYKSVLDEIREYIKENITPDSEYTLYMEMRKENYNELLQILDKVKE